MTETNTSAMKKILNSVLKGKISYRKFIILLGSFLGFTTSIVAQYGAPMAHYRISGVVKSKDCNVPIPHIKVSLNNNNNYYNSNYEPFTDSLGKFELGFYADYGEDLNKLKMLIEAEDVDGEKNYGNFMAYEKVILIKQNKESGGRYPYKNDDIIIEMDYKGKSPCKPKVREDTTPNPDPPLHKLALLSDTIDLINSIPDSLSSLLSENNDSLNSNGRNEPPDNSDPDIYVIYPNPSKGQFTVELMLKKATKVSMNVYDSGSKLIISESWGNCEGLLQKPINLEGKAPGTYYLIINTGVKKYTGKLVKQ